MSKGEIESGLKKWRKYKKRKVCWEDFSYTKADRDKFLRKFLRKFLKKFLKGKYLLPKE
jgi:hypothetical protein